MDFLIERAVIFLTIRQLTGLKKPSLLFFPNVDEHILSCPSILSVFMIYMKKSWPAVGGYFGLETGKSWPAAV